MNTITFKDYKQAIKKHYSIAQANDVSGILAHPSPAQLRTLTLIILDKGVSKREEESLRIFFEAKEGEDLKRAIQRFSIDKFKSIISFLKGEKDTENAMRVEIAALLIGFKDRPYTEFSKTGFKESQNEGVNVILFTPPGIPSENKTQEKKSNFFLWIEKNKLITIFMLIALVLFGFSFWQFVFTEKQCMQWQNDHYEVVDCINSATSSSGNDIIALNKSLLTFRKVEVVDTTIFFSKQGKPLYWYCKVNGKPDFFNELGDGRHPETGKSLNPITHYIIDKYVLKK
ncbi:hypothetical protein [Flavobacterium lacus]|uniref:Uncharacterized protein n=1 Tax=Flavobacterium lacus TaxID=1353778 RepID=A0A328WQR6_9FLAO|nr:hypothetical protein [Flavobacterium lacus]RAR47605.1 hypothetical protein B0I10_108108 [Flavobacterium lacus]